MLSAATLLNAWERGLSENMLQRALSLLALVWPEASFDALSELSIGRRDWHLFWLYEALFGRELAAVATCPQCGENLELTLDAAALRGGELPEGEPGPVFLNVDGRQVCVRVPNSRDLLALMGEKHPEVARKQLLGRCVLDDIETAPLSDAALETIDTQLVEADPRADVRLDLSCPACGHQWLETFDIVSFLWSELNGWALRTLREVHLLASAYGWPERDILNLSAQRRQIYLQMIEV